MTGAPVAIPGPKAFHVGTTFSAWFLHNLLQKPACVILKLIFGDATQTLSYWASFSGKVFRITLANANEKKRLANLCRLCTDSESGGQSVTVMMNWACNSMKWFMPLIQQPLICARRFFYWPNFEHVMVQSTLFGRF